MMDSESSRFRILMFPWLAHGHIFPYLELAERILKKKNFQVFFCTTAINFSSIDQFIRKSMLGNSIELVQLHLEPNPLLPPHYHTTKNLPPDLNFTLLEAFQTAKFSFSDTISNLKPNLVMYDVFQPWAAQIASSLGTPAVHFAPFGAAANSYTHHHYICGRDNFPFPELCISDQERESFDALIEFLHVNVYDQDKDVSFVNYRLSSEVVLLKTSRAFEGKYIDYVSSVSQKRILAVGPLVTKADQNEEENSEILLWLNKKNQNSTVYISFGSEFFLSKEEIEEIATGLELCEVNFIWVIRFPVLEKTVRIEEALPQGFLERVKDRGIIVSGWAPQASILGHPSTGAFISHCGWSSLNESVYHGVPVIGMPQKLSMFIDAKMLVDVGVCVEVPRDESAAYKREAIAKVINEVIVEKTGEGLRHRAQELSEKIRMEEEQAIDETAEQLWQLCIKNKGK